MSQDYLCLCCSNCPITCHPHSAMRFGPTIHWLICRYLLEWTTTRTSICFQLACTNLQEELLHYPVAKCLSFALNLFTGLARHCQVSCPVCRQVLYRLPVIQWNSFPAPIATLTASSGLSVSVPFETQNLSYCCFYLHIYQTLSQKSSPFVK